MIDGFQSNAFQRTAFQLIAAVITAALPGFVLSVGRSLKLGLARRLEGRSRSQG